MSEWIEWSGGGCPVEPQLRVEAKFRNPNYYPFTQAACDWDWSHENHPADIIAYRIRGEQEAQP